MPMTNLSDLLDAELAAQAEEPTPEVQPQGPNSESLTSLSSGVVAAPEGTDAATPTQVDAPDSAQPSPDTQGSKRKPGQRKPTFDDESTSQLAKTSKSLIRTDWGGKSGEEALELIRQKMAAHGLQAGPVACEAIRKLCEDQVEGCRKRSAPRLDEIIRRLDGTAVVEVLP